MTGNHLRIMETTDLMRNTDMFQIAFRFPLKGISLANIAECVLQQTSVRDAGLFSTAVSQIVHNKSGNANHAYPSQIIPDPNTRSNPKSHF